MFNWLVALLFFVDIGINFRTTFINTRSGDEIWDPKMISKRYVFGGRFWIDFISSIPLDELSGGNIIFSLFGMLKILRVTRLGTIITNMNVR